MIARKSARRFAGPLLGVAMGFLAGFVQPAAASVAEQDGDAQLYSIREVLVQGAGAFKPETLRALYAPALMHQMSDAEIGGLADSVTNYYRQGGYFLASTTVPRQRLDYGMLVLRVAEGDIAAVQIEGDPALYTAPMKAAVAQLLAVHPMTEAAFTQALKPFTAAKATRTTLELAPSALGEGHYELNVQLSRGPTAVVYASRADQNRGGTVAASPAAFEAGAGTSANTSELAPDLMTRPLASDRYGPGAAPVRARPAVGPFYVPKADGRRDAYTLLDHGPGWYKRSEDTAGIPTALGVRLRDDDTKVGFEAGIPYDKRVEPIGARDQKDPVQVLFTVDRHF